MKPKPSCPRCNTITYVKTSGGGSPGQYRYMCNFTGCIINDDPCEWQQVPPHRLALGDIPRVTFVKRSKGLRPYKCKQCGKRKKNHRCVSIEQGNVSVYDDSDFNDVVHLMSPGLDIPMPNVQNYV